MNTIIVKLTIMLITGPFALTKDQTKEMYQDVKARLVAEVGVDLKLQKLRHRSDLFKQFSTLNSRLQRYLSWKLWLTNTGRLKTKQLTYLVFPPMPHSDGKRYISGYASSICTYKTFRTLSTGNAQMVNQDNQARLEHSKLVMGHELMHQLGAIHEDWTPNVMHPNAQIYVGSGSWWAVPILPVTVSQVRKCTK